jgi:3'-5' exoribonuclease 1
VEATCEKIEGPYTRLAFSYPNEIIEFPVVLLKWQRMDEEGTEWALVQVDEFHSFVRPTWNPRLSSFCSELTGISQVR